MDLFKLVGSVFVDNSEANDSLSKTDKKASSLGDTFGKVAKGAAVVGGAAIAGATALTTSVVSMASASAESMDVIDKGSQRMKVSAEYYQELAHAAGQSGVEMSTLEKAAKSLEGTDINMEQALDQIYSMETAEERARVAADLFGESVAYKMTPMLNESGEGFAALRQEANDLGLVFSGDAVTAGAAMGDTLANIQASAEALVTQIGVAVMPIVQQFCDLIVAYMPQIHAMVEQLTPIITQAFEVLLPPLMQLVETLLPVIFDLIQQLFPPIMEVINAILPVLSQLIMALLPPLLQVIRLILPILINLIRTISPILQPIITLLAPIIRLATALLTPLLQLINMILPPVINLVTKLANALAQKVGPAINKAVTIFTNFKNKVKTIFEQVKNAVKGPINAILSFINGLIRGVVGGVNGIIRALNRFQIKVPQWVTNLTGVSTFGFNLAELTAPQIPLLAKGGEIDGGSAIVGEDGPELLQTDGRRTRVTPLNDNNNAFVALEEKMDRMIELLQNGFGVYLDGRAVVGQLAPGMDQALGQLAVKQARRA